MGDDTVSLSPVAERPSARWRLLPGRVRARFTPRVAAILLTLLIEGLVLVLLFTMSPTFVRMRDSALAVFDVGAEPAPAPSAEDAAPAPAGRAAEESAPTEPARETPPPLPRAQPAPSALLLVPITRDQMAAADLATMPPRAAPDAGTRRGKMGPVNSGVSGDSEHVGSAPNGEPMYAASWYRKPTDGELRGYLSTAEGPGWGLIACRTVADYRVEDCAALDEWPTGSRINRAVLAAAWQFRVRPPRIGGRSKVGQWVRIRIDYGMRR